MIGTIRKELKLVAETLKVNLEDILDYRDNESFCIM